MVLLSNQTHSSWIQKKLSEKLKQLAGKKITILGLGYKPGTNCLNHSLMVNIANGYIKVAQLFAHMIR